MVVLTTEDLPTAVIEAVADLKRQVAEKGLPPAGRTWVATASPMCASGSSSPGRAPSDASVTVSSYSGKSARTSSVASSMCAPWAGTVR